MTRRSCCLCVLFLALPLLAAAKKKDYNIHGDTIRVTANVGVLLKFPGMPEYPSTCPAYLITTGNNAITILSKSGKFAPPCQIVVTEGSKKSKREHTFMLIYVKDLEGFNQIHDYSTKKLIAQRNEELENSRQKKPGGQPGNNAPAADDGIVRSRRTTPLPAEANAENSSGIKNFTNEEINERVNRTINAFFSVCKKLSLHEDVPGTIKYGMEMFDNNEDAIVETRNAKGGPQKKTIRAYYNSLIHLPYKRIEMVASQVHFISQVHLGADGKYHGTAQIIQDFKGIKDGNIVAYLDKTEKTFDFIVKMIKTEVGGKPVETFEIFFINISVTREQ